MSNERKGYAARLEVTGPDGDTYVVEGLVAEEFAVEVQNADPFDYGYPFRLPPGRPLVELVRFDFKRPVPTGGGVYYTTTKKEPANGN